jgi:LysM repeat protein
MSLFLSSLLLAGSAMGAPFTTSDPNMPIPAPWNTTITPPVNGTVPSPLQPGVVSNCDEYYLVKSGDICINVASSNGITLDEFLAWNPEAGATCTNLLADAYACVSVTGHTPTPTKPDNGIETPQPIQAGMVDNCNKFHLVASGQTCDAIEKEYDVELDDLVKWNPAIKDDCTGMWAATNLCVGVTA